MEYNRKITLTEKNLTEINNICSNLLNSEFLRFCVINKIIEIGIKTFKDVIVNQKVSHALA